MLYQHYQLTMEINLDCFMIHINSERILIAIAYISIYSLKWSITKVKITLTVPTSNDTHSVTLIKIIKPLESLMKSAKVALRPCECVIWLQVFTISALYSGPTKIYTFSFVSKCSCRVPSEPAVNRRNNRCVCKNLAGTWNMLCYHYDALLYEICLYWKLFHLKINFEVKL